MSREISDFSNMYARLSYTVVVVEYTFHAPEYSILYEVLVIERYCSTVVS